MASVQGGFSGMPDALTEHLQAWRSGGGAVDAALSRHVYGVLKDLARQRLRAKREAFAPTELVHEAVARMLGSEGDWQSRSHFYALAALQMRAVLVDHARRVDSLKRGGGAVAVTLSPELPATRDAQAFLELDDALGKLAAEDARTARVLELTYFGGLNAAQTAEVVGVSDATVERDLAFGRAWLKRAMGA